MYIAMVEKRLFLTKISQPKKILVSAEIRTHDLSTEFFIAIAPLPSLRRKPFSTVAPKIGPYQVASTQTDL